MSMDLTGITNKNEYYTNHYFSTVFEENAGDTITAWNLAARESAEIRTPWSNLRRNTTQFYAAHDRFIRSSVNMQTLQNIRELADSYLNLVKQLDEDVYKMIRDDEDNIRLHRIYSGAVNRYIEYLSGKRVGRIDG